MDLHELHTIKECEKNVLLAFLMNEIMQLLMYETYRAIKHSNCLFSILNIPHCNKCKSPASIRDTIIHNLQNSIKQNQTQSSNRLHHKNLKFINQTGKKDYKNGKKKKPQQTPRCQLLQRAQPMRN